MKNETKCLKKKFGFDTDGRFIDLIAFGIRRVYNGRKGASIGLVLRIAAPLEACGGV